MKIEEIEKSLAEKKSAENSDLSCKKCGKTFKKVIAKKKHNCEAKSPIAQTGPPRLPLQESNSSEFSCILCQKIITEVPILKKHYIVEHFQDFFKVWSKLQGFPGKFFFKSQTLFTLCSRNFQNVKLRLDFVEI